MSTSPEYEQAREPPPRPRSARGPFLIAAGFTAVAFLAPLVAAVVLDDGSGEGGVKGIFLVFGFFASLVTGSVALVISLIAVAIYGWLTSTKKAGPPISPPAE
ncbi:hypothetical protein ACLESO_14765 [Pyxidicoccus sp. 3LG]